MQRTGAVATLQRYKADGYKYIYFEQVESYRLNPRAVAVDMVWPGDDFVKIESAIADTNLLRGRMLTAA